MTSIPKIYGHILHIAKSAGPLKLIGEFRVTISPHSKVIVKNPHFVYNRITSELQIYASYVDDSGLSRDLFGVVSPKNKRD